MAKSPALDRKAGGQDNSVQQALLVSQLKDVEARLNGVGMVRTLGAQRSPYNGTVKKIKWSGQINQEWTVEVNLMIQVPGGAL